MTDHKLELMLRAKAHALGAELREVLLSPAPNHWYWQYQSKSNHGMLRASSVRQFKSAQEAFDDLMRFLTQRGNQ